MYLIKEVHPNVLSKIVSIIYVRLIYVSFSKYMYKERSNEVAIYFSRKGLPTQIHGICIFKHRQIMIDLHSKLNGDTI